MNNKQYRKIREYLKIIDYYRTYDPRPIGGMSILPCGYKSGPSLPSLEGFAPYNPGDRWGDKKDSHAWFHFSFSVPEDMRGKNVELVLKTDHTGWDTTNSQLMTYLNGKLRHGFDKNHTYLILDESEYDSDVMIYAYTGPKVTSSKLLAELRCRNMDAEKLYYDISVPFGMLDYLDTNGSEYASILKYLDKAVSLLDLYDAGSPEFLDSLKTASDFMTNEFYGKYCTTERGIDSPTVIGIGHTHIDCAWLWPLKQTREKAQRSFSTVVELMERYPDYKFMSSQPLLYQDVKEENPELYEKIKEKVKKGQWEPEGGMWVEADCNLTSGESLVRQILCGKRFFRDEFGKENHVLWLPDVFGYSAALPQILKKSGIDWFVTSKISWNDTNKMPYDTFAWRGIDGTTVNTYFLTAQDMTRGEPGNGTTYNASTDAKQIAGTWRRYQQKELNNEALITYGYGDGGGGPTIDHLEKAERLEKGIPGAPVLKLDFAGDFLSRLGEKIKDNPLLPEWRGELYLEYHRGTYTSIAKNKRNNRQSEFLYLDAEFLSVLDKELKGVPFPAEELDRGWHMILTNQFHDIIPGSSIQEVYDQCDIDYAEIKRIGGDIVDKVRADIASGFAKEDGYVVFNPHSFTGKTPVKVDGVSRYVNAPVSKGYFTAKDFLSENSVRIDGKTVETNRLKVVFDDFWQIISIYDKKEDREVLAKGAVANELRLYADRPDAYDAWEWQAYSRDKYKPLTSVGSVELVEDGIRRGIKLTRPYMASMFTQTIWFCDDEARIDFETVVDWHQHHQMLKTAFPVDVNSDKATYEIQFGTTERPTHMNTSWDEAKFEVCAHKYADLSDGGYGVSIINDCKYGHDIHGNTITLSLLRSPSAPAENADQGEIRFTYSICPHAGTLRDSDTVKTAYYLNYPMTAVKATGNSRTLPETFSAVTLDRDNVVCETVKESEDKTGTVLRLYECKNIIGKLTIGTDIPFAKAYLCDLLENQLSELPVKDGRILTKIKGFEILTIKLVK